MAAATVGRDRVRDAVKAGALLAVVVGHSLAWHVSAPGQVGNVLELVPGLVVLTWLFQVLPLFFAAGAASNAESLARHGRDDFWRHRARSLVTPVLIYAGCWTLVALPFSAQGGTVEAAGRFLSQLLWFAGVYLAVVATVPLTARWRSRPILTLLVWLGAIAAVDAARIGGAPGWVGWLNLLLVWGWLHQLGYHLGQLRTQPRGRLIAAGVVLLLAAGVLVAVGPYSPSLVTVSGDAELSNLAPPSLVLACYGAAQVCLLAAAWPLLDRWLADDRHWIPVALVGARGMGIYLWHIPLVGVAAGLALALDWVVPAFSWQWWLVHLAVVAVVLPGAWLIAGVAGRGEQRLRWVPAFVALPGWLLAVGGAAVILSISTTGFATWWGAGMLGLPSGSLLNLVVLVLIWQGGQPTRTSVAPTGVRR